jgi:SAM-dependent methyltransferase
VSRFKKCLSTADLARRNPFGKSASVRESLGLSTGRLKMLKIPHPPEHLLMRVSNNPSVADFVNSFEHCRGALKRYLVEAGLNFDDFNRILDLGCGVGRFLFAIQPELRSGQRLWACDVFEECARWCRDNIDFAEVAHNNIEPPLPYDDEQFDFVYALSVFTHLRVDLQFKWAWEVYRVLRPGGVLFATIHGPLFIPLLYAPALKDARQQQMFTLGDKGLFAYMAYSGNADDEGQVNVAAAQNIDFVKEQFSAFEFVRAFPQSDLAAEQDLYIIRKPNHGRPLAKPLASGRGQAQQCTWIEKIATTRNPASLSLRFKLDRHLKFRVYPRISVPAVVPLDCQIHLRTKDSLLFSERVPLNIQRLFGDSHYFVVELDVPEYTGEITADLVCLPRGSSTLNDSAVKEVEWNFPNFT